MKRSPLKRSPHRESAAKREARQKFNREVSGPCFFRGIRPCFRCGGESEYREGTIGPQTVGQEPQGRVHVCTTCHGEGVHNCKGYKDAHHLVGQQWLKRNYSDLREDMLLTICFDPRIAVPLCRAAHESVTAKRSHIYWHELPEEAREFAADIDQLYLRFPLPWGGQRQSMLERLKLECPERVEGVVA